MFEKNMLLYLHTGNAGACPVCGEKLIVNIIKTPSRDSVDIRCDKCQKADFFSGVFKESKNMQ